MRFSQWLNLAGFPGASVPIAVSSEGLPIGIQVIGRPFEDELVLAVAETSNIPAAPGNLRSFSAQGPYSPVLTSHLFLGFPVPFLPRRGKMRRMNRRTFIGTSIAASLAAAAKPSWAADSTHHIDRIGIQLYTVRDAMKTDFEGTIAKVAATGYKEVEFAGYFDHSPKDVRAILDKNGLASPSCHVGYDVVEKKWPETHRSRQNRRPQLHHLPVD